MTRSPTAKPLTPLPTCSTVPENSPPGENGSGGFFWYLPAMIRVSKKLRPTAATLATTSPAPAVGSGMSSSVRSSGVPGRVQRMAFKGAGCVDVGAPLYRPAESAGTLEFDVADRYHGASGRGESPP